MAESHLPAMAYVRRRARSFGSILALLAACTAVYLWWTWPLAESPASAITRLRSVSSQWGPVLLYDRLLTIAGTARNSQAILAGTWSRLIDTGLCYPFPHAAVLGEHMIELGVLAAPFRWLNADPVFLHNATLWASLAISAVGMAVWVFFWTACAPAAAVAGMAFAFHPARLVDFAHPAVVAVHWLPWMLLFFDRLLARGRVADAILLSGCAVLQALTGSYPLLVATLLAVVYGPIRLAQQRQDLDRRRVVLLAAAILVACGPPLAVLLSYLRAQETWALFAPRQQLYADYGSLLAGGRSSLGWFVTATAMLAVLAAVSQSRFLSRRAGGRATAGGRPPVAALVLGAGVCTGFAARGSPWPGAPSLPSLHEVLLPVVPLIGSVRAPAAVWLGTLVAGGALAGFGVARLCSGRRPAVRAAIALAAAVLALAETLVPGYASRVHGRDFRLQPRPLSARPAELAAYRAFDDAGLEGPVLDLPFPVSLGRGIAWTSHYTFLAGYHGRDSAACYNSFNPPTQLELVRISEQLPAQPALEALIALGIRNLVVHRRWASAELREGLQHRPDVEILLANSEATALRLRGQVSVHHDLSRLEALSLHTPARLGRARKAKEILASFLRVRVRNRDSRVWTPTVPLRPLRARLSWYASETGQEARVEETRILPPLGLAGGKTAEIVLRPASRPGPGSYRLELAIHDLHATLRAPGTVRVLP